mgnify:CR=1 FL=1
MVVLLPLLVAVVGVLIYVLSADPKVQEMGRIMFFCGLLAFLMRGAEQVISLF